MKGIKLSFGQKEVLRGVDLDVPAHASLVVMGASGSGKSTLLSILLGLLEPDAGEAKFQDQDIPKLRRRELNAVRTKIGMVYQNAALVSSMTVGENIALPLEELSDKKEDEIEAIVGEKLKLVGLEDAKDKLPSELSGGMQKRAGMARALALGPELVLFDEPSAGLDPVNSRMIDELIIRLREEEKVTSVIVTHEMDSAFMIATRMAFLHEGRMVFAGEPAAFKESEHAAVKEFLSAYEDKDARAEAGKEGNHADPEK
jgi:phospholipid/cholesterol/gamma-HCH transport system ATP-binding protein